MTGDLRRPAVVLLVDQDDACRLVALLEADGYTVWHANCGADARQILKEARRAGASADIVLIREGLPDVDGRVLTAFLRGRLDAPIVLCAPAGQASHRAIIYHAGVDGFLPSPVDRDELHALLQTLLRRRRLRPHEQIPAADEEAYRVGSLVVYERRRTVLLDSEHLLLSPAQYQVLLTLARQPNVLVPVSELANALWGPQPLPGAGALVANQVARLRARLREGSRTTPPSIVNVPSRGYLLLAA